MVMLMDAYSDQTMASTVEDSPAIDSESYRQQESAEDEQNDDEHSKGSSQTVVVQHQQQFQVAENRQVEDKQTDEHIAMIVSRGSSIDDEQKLMMNVDDESTSPSGKKFGSASVEKKSAASSRFARPAGRVDSLVAQMRDIVEGSPSAKLESEPQRQEYEREQPKSSSDSLNNQNENNNSKASIDSTVHKRTRHSRGHCRHHHHQHRHRQSSSGTSFQGAETIASTGDGQTIQGHPHPHHHHHHHHHHHRHVISAHRQHAHHHPHHHHHHPHHHHHHHQQERRGTVSKRSSIQRPSLALIDPTGSALNLVGTSQKQQITRDSHSSMSSVSSTAGQQNDQIPKQCRQSNPSQSNPNDSKSSETPSDEKNLGDENVRQPSLRQQTFNQGGVQHGHHHHHHHHCHHRSHKKRLVLENVTNADNQQRMIQDSSESQMTAQFNSNAEEPSVAQDSNLGSDVPKRDALQDLALETKSLPSGSGQHKHQCGPQPEFLMKHHVHHAHPHHHHHHRHPHHHCVAPTQRIQDFQPLSKDTDEQQANRPHHHHHHRHHRHHHHCHHHGHHCKHHKLKQKADSKSNVDELSNQEPSKQSTGETVEFDSERQAAANNNATANVSSRRISSVSTTMKDSSTSKQTYIDRSDGTETSNIKSNDRDVREDDVVKMEMSPSSERKSSRHLDSCEPLVSSETPDPNLVTSIEVAPGFTEQNIMDNRRSSQSNNQQLINNQQMQTAKDSDFNNTEGSNEASQRPIHDSSYKPDGSHESNQENCYVGDVSGGASRQNKLVRQMSSQSSKKSQKGEVSRDGQSRNEQLSDYSTHPLQSMTNQQSGQPKQIVESSVPSDRRCRLCWCCCCPCSAFSVKEVANRTDPIKTSNEPSNSPTSKFPSLPNVPLEEIRSWGESFDKLMKCSDGRKVFQDFLRCEYSEENILFWTACEDLKKERDSKSIASKARDIYEDYISILSSKEVSLDSRVRDIINNNIKKPTSNIFDEAQLQIYTLMHRDSYPRFINSAMYKKLAQIPSNMSRKSSS